jgi:hypothetical protein
MVEARAMSDSIIILRARGRRLAKAVRADGGIEGYDSARTVDLHEAEIADLGALEDLLRRLEHRRDRCVVRGAIVDPSRVKAVRRLLYRDVETGDEPTLREAPRRWLALDFDTLALPAGVAPEDLIGCGCTASESLPAEFLWVRTIVQATASHGLKPGARLRLWYWLDRPVGGDELKYWLRAAPVDLKIFGAAQVIYTAAPLFLTGSFDPLPTRIAVIPGDEAVAVPAPARLKPPPRQKAVPQRDTRRDDHNERAIGGLVRSVAHAGNGDRNSILYWAARRLAEKVSLHAISEETARALLEEAAQVAGLPAKEAAATVRSGLRHG